MLSPRLAACRPVSTPPDRGPDGPRRWRPASRASRARVLPLVLAALLAGGCDAGGGRETGPTDVLRRALRTITAERLRTHVEVIADDATGGRRPNSDGSRMARNYILDVLAEAGVEPAGGDGTYLHSYESGTNVAARVPGTHPTETVVYMGHYDHLGRDRAGNVFNGAFDDAGAVALGLELARALTAARYRPRRTILFLFTDEEEYGLNGARAVAQGKGPVPPGDIVFAFSGDPLGRSNLPDYSWVGFFGLEHSPTLWELVDAHAHDWIADDLVLAHRDLIKIFRSDQDPFLDAGIPAMWFVNAGFSFYHTTADTPDTIQYDVLIEDVKVAAQLLDLVANDDERYPFVHDAPLEVETAIQMRTVFEGLHGSQDDLRAWEVEAIEWVLDRIDAMEARGVYSPADGDDVTLLGGLATVFTLARTHEGPLPPPFPEGRTAALD